MKQRRVVPQCIIGEPVQSKAILFKVIVLTGILVLITTTERVVQHFNVQLRGFAFGFYDLSAYNLAATPLVSSSRIGTKPVTGCSSLKDEFRKLTNRLASHQVFRAIQSHSCASVSMRNDFKGQTSNLFMLPVVPSWLETSPVRACRAVTSVW
eukprot:615105-Pleurochrysis_carterae.AAC.1